MTRLPVWIDIGPAVHQRAGLSRYAAQVAGALLREEAHRLDITLLYNAHSGHAPPVSLAAARCVAVEVGQRTWRFGSLLSQMLRMSQPRLRRAILAGVEPPTLYHATEHLLPRLPMPTVMTVHDLIFERYPQHHTRLNRLFLRAAMPTFVAAADAIIAVSGHTRNDLCELYRTDPAKLHVIYEGIDTQFRPAEQEETLRVKTKYSPDRPYLLMVGTLEPRKNHATALRALARLKAEGEPHRLIVAGGKGWLFEPIRALVSRLGLENDVFFAGYVPQEELPALYSGADAVLVPSLYEGFGFPVLEAMACGAPVVASRASSLPEVAGGAVLLTDAEDDAALAGEVRRVLHEPRLAASLREAGLRRAAEFSWSRCARETADLYLDVARRA